MQIQFDETLLINGVRQFVSIRGEQAGLPLLIYLHGGPGDAALPLVLRYNGELAKKYILVVWEQRGAGKSYCPFGAQETIRIDDYVQDLRALTGLLLRRFEQSKVYLVGHSWGSVVGLLFCKQYPQFVEAYIGCGQVVNMKKSSEIARRFALEHAAGKTAERLAQIDCTYTGERWLDDLLFVTKQVVKHQGSLYGKSSYNRLILDFLFSKEYRLKDLVNRQKGALQSIRYLWQELMTVSFEETTAFEMPVIFVEGKYDAHVSSALAKAYYDRITSPKAFYLFERSCHFPQWSEGERFNRLLMRLPGAEL